MTPMALLHDAVKDKTLDTRLVERNIARGVVSDADVKSALASLPDEADNAAWVRPEELQDELEDDAENGNGSSNY